MINLVKLANGEEIMGHATQHTEGFLELKDIMVVTNTISDTSTPKFVPWLKQVRYSLAFMEHPIRWDNIMIVFDEHEILETTIELYRSELAYSKHKYVGTLE